MSVHIVVDIGIQATNMSLMLTLEFLNCIDVSIYEILNKILESMMKETKAPFLSALTEDIHVLPDFHGNR